MITGGQKPKRNEPCPCGSGLKYKWCHGDQIKTMSARDAMNMKMAELIIKEKIKRRMIESEDSVPEPEPGLIIQP